MLTRLHVGWQVHTARGTQLSMTSSSVQATGATHNKQMHCTSA